MRARAPGKLVVSGAYAVLEGAPSIVTAVSRYVLSDSDRPAELVTPEVRAAIGDEPAPWFDASALRGPRGKLGLGSSAAILVASLAALELERRGVLEDRVLADLVLQPALRAHRQAQGGGSGIDVAASARGGTLIARRGGDDLELESAELPTALHLEVWAGGAPASTTELVGRVRDLAARDRAAFDACVQPLSEAAERAATALREGRADELLAALGKQCTGLERLGRAAGAPIVTTAVAKLHAQALREDAVVLPSGAGGGDVALYLGFAAPSAELVALRSELEHEPVELTCEARGVHALSS